MRNKKFLSFLIISTFLVVTTGCGKSETEKKEFAEETVESSKEVAMVIEGGDKKEPQPAYVEGEMLLKFKKDIPKESHQEIIEEYGCSVINYIENINIYKVKIPEGKTVLEMTEILGKDERIKYAEPNVIYRIQDAGSR